MDRALRILQAIANECAAPEGTLEPEPTDDRRFRISTSERHFELTLTEELVDPKSCGGFPVKYTRASAADAPRPKTKS